MGKHTIILDKTKKESLDCGKVYFDKSGFQMPSARIIAFLTSRVGHEIQVITDDHELPEDTEDGWTEIDSFANT